MVLVNSRNPRFPATLCGCGREAHDHGGHTFSRSYGAILPSSLASVLSRALGYSPHLPESVCGTVTIGTPRGAFLGSVGSRSYRSESSASSPLGVALRQLSVCPLRVLESSPTGLNRHTSNRLRLPFSVPPRFNVLDGGAGILTCLPSPTPFGLGLGTD